jgi:hypothetical protein
MPPNRLREAFNEKPNLIGLASSVAVSAALLNPVPLLVGLVAEAAYLLFVPDSTWYGRILKVREGEQLLHRRAQVKATLLPALHPELRERYQRLEELRRQIATQTADDADLFGTLSTRLDFLLEKYLHFAAKEAQFRDHLRRVHNEARQAPTTRPPAQWSDTNERPSRRSAPPARASTDERWAPQVVEEIKAHYARELASITQTIAAEDDDSTKAVLVKRSEVVRQRADNAEKIGKTLGNLHHQLALLDDTFGLISDQIHARTPDQLLADVDDVVQKTDTMVRVLDEMAPFEQLTERMELE